MPPSRVSEMSTSIQPMPVLTPGVGVGFIAVAVGVLSAPAATVAAGVAVNVGSELGVSVTPAATAGVEVMASIGVAVVAALAVGGTGVA